MKISMFLPVYNGENIVRDNTLKVYNFLKKNFDEFELIVVDDNSKDNTRRILSDLAKNYKIRVIKCENGPSRRENLFESMTKAKYDLVSFMDLDLVVPLDSFKELVKSINQGYDIAIGSRRTSGAKVKRSSYRKIWSFLYHSFVKILFNSNIKDYQCGFKVFKKKAFIQLKNESGYDKKYQRGWFFDAELLIRAERNGYKIKEVPVSWIASKESSFSVRRELKTVVYMLKLWKRLRN